MLMSSSEIIQETNRIIILVCITLSSGAKLINYRHVLILGLFVLIGLSLPTLSLIITALSNDCEVMDEVLLVTLVVQMAIKSDRYCRIEFLWRLSLSTTWVPMMLLLGLWGDSTIFTWSICSASFSWIVISISLILLRVLHIVKIDLKIKKIN